MGQLEEERQKKKKIFFSHPVLSAQVSPFCFVEESLKEAVEELCLGILL